MSSPGTLRFGQVGVKPSAPPVGYDLVYVKTDDVLYIQDSSGVEVALGSASAITQLTGDVSAIGPGIATATVNFVGGESAANVASATIAYLAATSSDTPSTLVLRDSSGNFSAGTITANLTGTATNATTAINFTGSLSGDVTGTQSATVVAFVGGSSAASVHSAELAANAATPSNTASTIVKRDASGNFAAGTITANLTGTATNATTAVNFSGSLSGDVTGTQSATVVSLVGGQSAASVASAVIEVAAATSANTPSTLVLRDGSGNFSAGTITANLTGTATNATNAVTAVNFSGSLSGDVTGTQSATAISSTTVTGKLLTGYTAGTNTPILSTDSILIAFEKLQAQISGTAGTAITALTGDVSATGPGSSSATVNSVGGQTAAAIAAATIEVDAATSSNTASTLVLRDASGNFAAGTITANLTGTATNATNAVTAVNFSGSLSGDVTGTQSATSIASTVVTGKLLTGYTVGTNTPISATDSILGAFEKVQGQINATSGSAITALTGDVVATGPGSVTATIQPNSVTNSKLAQMTANTVKANITGGTANPTDAALGTVTETTSSVLTLTGWTDATIGSPTITVKQSSTSQSGYLSSTDWNTFNNKQPAGNYITALTGDVVATGPGSSASTIQTNVVSNSKLAQAPTNTLKGNNTGVTANVTDLTTSQVNTLLGTVTTIGTIDGNGASANGLSISGNSLFAQSASNSNPGLVNNTTQTFSGNKNFNGNVLVLATSTTAVEIGLSSQFIFDSTNSALGIGLQPSTAAFIDAVNSTAASKTLQLTGYGIGSTVGTRGRFARGTSGTPTAAQTGDIINFWSARGYGASQFAAASTAAINAVAGENFTNTSNLTYLSFNTTPTGSVTSAENFRVASTGVTLGPQTSSTSIHQINGGLFRTNKTITANYTVDTTTTDDIIFCNQSAGITVTLPAPTNGRSILIKDISGNAQTNTITIVRHASEKIENLAASRILYTNYGTWTFVADGTNWWMC